MKNRTVLMIAYEFPPEGARGTKRGMKFLSYLPEHGFEPVILTVKNGNYEYHDGSLLKDIPEKLPVYRAVTLESIFYKRSVLKENEVRDTRLEKDLKFNNGMFRQTILKLYHFTGKFLRIPDSKILWLPFAIIEGFLISKKHRIDLIFASGPSFTNHITGALLKKVLRKPLITDYRDSWVSDPAMIKMSKWQKKIMNKLEKFTVKSADRIVATTDGIRDDLKKRYRQYNYDHKVFTVTHGYDERDFLNSKKLTKTSSQFHIVHSGTLGWERNPYEFLKAFSSLLEKYSELSKKIKITFVGQCTPFQDGKRIEDYVKELSLERCIELTGFVSKKTSIDYMFSADVLLLIIGRVQREGADIYGISAKIYDYAYARKPVITIAEEGATSKMARFLNVGPVIYPEDYNEIQNTILNYYNKYCSKKLVVDSDSKVVSLFSYSNLTKKLSEHFQNVLDQTGN